MITDILISKIRTTKDQPRKHFDQKTIEVLAESIKQQGLLQPIVVGPLKDGHYDLIIGERRLRAHQFLKRRTIKGLIIEAGEEASTYSLVENLQREDLSPIEEALAYQKLLDAGLTQTELAKKIGRSQSLIAQKMALFKLPVMVQTLLRIKELTEGHARQLLWFKSLFQGWVFLDEKKLLTSGIGIYNFSDELMRELSHEEETLGEDTMMERYRVTTMVDHMVKVSAVGAAYKHQSVGELRNFLEDWFLRLQWRSNYYASAPDWVVELPSKSYEGQKRDRREKEEDPDIHGDRHTGRFTFKPKSEWLVAMFQSQIIKARRGLPSVYDWVGDEYTGHEELRIPTPSESAEIIKNAELRIRELRALRKRP